MKIFLLFFFFYSVSLDDVVSQKDSLGSIITWFKWR